ncbi:hypothetical protein SO694_00112098 [Aureococcus anophagefferens]|uniref:Uncharacterized protein n=1 Tax=Aureococcus anophagefferens TaxID=44056 RepID=A0ABR1FWQ3_AURAN
MGNIFQRCKDDADDTGRGASRDEPPPAKAPLPEEEAKAPPSHAHDHGHGHGHDHGGGEHAQVISLGTATLGGGTLMADREGECAAGAATTFGVEALGAGAADGGLGRERPPRAALRARARRGPRGHALALHDHARRRRGPRYLVVCSDEDHIARFALFPGAAPARGGILAPLYVAGGDHAGFLELKLHDDLGDLELWLTDLKGGPLDVPHSAFVALKCASLGRAVKLGIRNLDSNEDEDGVPNMRDGETNYFIFPAVPGTDASWLKGTEWRAAVERRRGAALVAVGGSYAGGGYAFAAHGASATVDGGAYAGGGVLRLEGGAAAAVVGGTFANGTTAVDAADSNVTVRGGAFSGFAGPVLRARGGSAVVVLGGSYDGPSSDGFAVAGRGGAVDVAGGTFRFASREAGAALVNGSGAVAVSGAFLRVGDRWCAVLAAGAEGAFAVGGFAGPLARTYASAGAYAAAAACLAEATCYEITATGAAAGWTFAGRDYAGDGVVPFSLGADLRADGAPAASNATCPRSSRSGGDAGRDLDLLLAYSVVVLAIIGAVALSVTGCYVARRSADDVEKPRQVAPGDSSPLPGRQTVAAPLVATAPTDLAAVSARTALDLAAITLPAGDAVVGPRRARRVAPSRGRGGGEATAPALKCIFRACEKAALGGRTLADVTDVLRARVACPTAAAVAARVRAPRPATVLRCVDGFAALAAAPWSSVVCLELQLDGVVAELAVAHAASTPSTRHDDALSLRAASAILELHGKGDDRPREETKDDGPRRPRPAPRARRGAAPPTSAQRAPPAAAPPEPEPARALGQNRAPPPSTARRRE